jgi:hypothetical protein
VRLHNMCGAQRVERSADRRAGHYERKLETKACEVKLQRVPKLHYQPACTRLTPLATEPREALHAGTQLGDTTNIAIPGRPAAGPACSAPPPP